MSCQTTISFFLHLQIIWKNSLLAHEVVEEVVVLVFEVMDDFKTGQASSMFRERAGEMGHLVLSNKGRQTTR